MLLPFGLYAQNDFVRMIVTSDGEVMFYRGQQQLFVRAYTGEPVYKADYYVATNGSDSNDGKTVERPLRTITKAESVMVAGDTALVRGGVYNESVRFHGQSGTAENPIVYKAYPGETPIVDGTGINPFVTGSALLHFSFSYVYLEGFTIRNCEDGDASGILLDGNYDKVSNCIVYNCAGSGIGMSGNYGIVEYCTVYNVCMDNENGEAESWGSGISARRYPDYCIIRHCIVHDVWGEGISTFEATHTTIEDNIIYDIYSVALYISDATDCLVQRNLVYTSKDMADGSQVGIGHWPETHVPNNARNTFINNIVYGCARNFCIMDTPHEDIFIYNNTFVNSIEIASVQFTGNEGNYENIIFKNNIVVQEDDLPVIYFNAAPPYDIAFSYNLWSKTPSASAQGTGDVIGDPLFTKTGSLLPGLLTGHYFDLQVDSPAIDAAEDIDLADDFFGNARGDDPDIGAIESNY